MIKKFLLFALILFLPNCFADTFIHEGLNTYTTNNFAMTTNPKLNHFLILDFNLSKPNTHIHLKVFDDRNALIQDYSFKYFKDEQSIKTAANIQKSTGYSFYRTLVNDGTNEYRIVSDDSGKVSAQLFLNPCGFDEVTGCYFQDTTYRLQLDQNGLNRSEYFKIAKQDIEVGGLVQSTSSFGNNVRDLLYYSVFLIFGGLIILIIAVFILKRFLR